MNHDVLIWVIAALAALGVIIRPWRWPEAIWACVGALLVVVLGLLSINGALAAAAKGTDVYLFLTGMMLLSETGRREGLFDWAAAHAVNHARASPVRLFLGVYFVGILVTIFLSNDATAVVLTPAVFAAARKAEVEPLPLLLICALVANAASFVLPISNPANLVLYGEHLPELGAWLARFALPSLIAIVTTFVILRWTQRKKLAGRCRANLPLPPLSVNGRLALGGIVLAIVTLLVVSALGISLGLPTAIVGVLVSGTILLRSRSLPWPLMKGISWGILPLVAGLFVLVEALDQTGIIRTLAAGVHTASQHAEAATAGVAGIAVAIASNLINNLPAGLIARSVVEQAPATRQVTDALLIGMDLGPNLSITGSLATILWLSAIRREGVDVGYWTFFKVGAVVMLPALVLALGAVFSGL